MSTAVSLFHKSCKFLLTRNSGQFGTAFFPPVLLWELVPTVSPELKTGMFTWQTASVSYVVGKYLREITRNKTTKLPSCVAFRRLSLHVSVLCANTGPYCQGFYFIFAFKDFSETSLKSGAGLSLQTPLFPPHRYFCTCWTVLSCAGRGVGLEDDACTSCVKMRGIITGTKNN